MDPQNLATVLKELQEIRQSISKLDEKIVDTKHSLQDEIHSMKEDLLSFQLKAEKLEDIHTWSKQFQENITLAELLRLRDDVASLKEYKAKSTVIFAVIQFGMATLVAWLTK